MGGLLVGTTKHHAMAYAVAVPCTILIHAAPRVLPVVVVCQTHGALFSHSNKPSNIFFSKFPCCCCCCCYRSDLSRRFMVGLVGYPNVGKSSTINAIFGSKKTAVAPTPGKTKHFQTLNVSATICLCDCPGKFTKKAASKGI